MAKVDLNYFLNKENEGVIFAKVTKSHDNHDVHGSYFDYSKYVGTTLDKSVDPNFIQSTIEDIDTAFGYFHYGDQITTVSFSKIDEAKKALFSGYKSFKPNCFDVNMVYVESVRSMDDPDTIDYLLENISETTLRDMGKLEICHIRDHGCKRGAAYLEKRMNQILGIGN